MNTLLHKIWDKPLSSSLADNKKLLINTLNAHSFNMARTDVAFYNALDKSDVLLPDGVSIIIAMRLLQNKRVKKIAGYDLFQFEMERLNNCGGKCFFMGSSNRVLDLIDKHIKIYYPKVNAGYYSPPYKPEFTVEENNAIIDAVNNFEPEVLFVGMTAPKQEKWSLANFDKLKAGHICSIGAVFDFFAGTVKRAPQWMIKLGLEWLYRLIREPKRMWKRYVIGNAKFMFWVISNLFRPKK